MQAPTSAASRQVLAEQDERVRRAIAAKGGAPAGKAAPPARAPPPKK